MAKLTANVAVRNPDTGEVDVFEIGEEPPEWAVPLIDNPTVWDEAPHGEDTHTGDGPPPKSGAKGTTDAWRTYATAQGVTVADDAKRDDIIAACSAAGVPVE
ncbi:hypothetical protein [Enterococcus hirae]|uniref:hypothetical protein n=1 Tax=Enterococcus hirae TaxID=1354 RepID=UPI00136BC45C|nr:hypothetical protein [Enterococcus hirae]NAE18049.1 hypothetical protein [Enterococcus hirae]